MWVRPPRKPDLGAAVVGERREQIERAAPAVALKGEVADRQHPIPELQAFVPRGHGWTPKTSQVAGMSSNPGCGTWDAYG